MMSLGLALKIPRALPTRNALEEAETSNFHFFWPNRNSKMGETRSLDVLPHKETRPFRPNPDDERRDLSYSNLVRMEIRYTA
jgi:hypothetical protein